MAKKTKLKNFATRNKLNASLVVILITAIGTFLLLNSHAATPYISINSSTGTTTGGATSQPCPGSSNGNCVVFSNSIPMDGNVALALTNPGTPFSPTSFWNTPLPDNVSINNNSQVYVNQVLNQLCYGSKNSNSQNTTPIPTGTTCPASNISTLNINTWSAPLYVVPPNQPYVTVQDSHCQGGTNTYFDNTVLAPGVPVPADAHGAGETILGSGDTDQEIQIYQPSTNKYWDFWKFVKNSSGVWTACYGGVINNVSNSNGIFTNNTGATATSLPLIGGVIRVDELQAGQINHVMNLSLMWNLPQGTLPANVPSNIPAANIHAYSWPATRNDGFGSNNNLAIPEGTRFRLPASFNLTQYNANLVSAGKSALTPIASAIATAAQKYGFVVDDSAGTVNFRLTDATTFTNTPTPNLTSPYTTGVGVGGVNDNNKGLFDGVGSGNIMANFPWDQLQALRYDYGEPGVPST